MAFVFTCKRAMAGQVHRLARARLEQSIVLLTGAGTLAATEAVHDVRTNLKRLRALLRLVRPRLDDRTYQRENMALRDAGRRLSASRNAVVLVQTLEGLTGRCEQALDQPSLEALRQILVNERDRVTAGETECDGELAPALTQAAQQLTQVLARVDDWAISGKGFAVIGKGLGATYGKGRTALDRAVEQGTGQAYHEWRKQAKYLWYDVRLLQPCWTVMFKMYRQRLKRIAELLGEAHDLAVLGERVKAMNITGAAQAGRADLLRLVDEQRGTLQDEAARIGRQVYAPKPAAFTRCVGKHFKAWRRNCQ